MAFWVLPREPVLTIQRFNDSPGRSPLFADQNQNPRYERHDSHHDCSDANVKERSDSNENQIDREQQHSNVLCDHASVLRQAGCLCTQKQTAARRIRFSYCALEGTRIASLMPCKNFLSAGTIVASAPRNFTRSVSTK